MLGKVLGDLVTVRTFLLLVCLPVAKHCLGPLHHDATIRTDLLSLIMSSPHMILGSRDCLLHLEANVAG